MGRGAERKIVQNAIFRGKRHDNKILKVKMLLSRNFVVMAQAPRVSHGLLPLRAQTFFKRVTKVTGGNPPEKSTQNKKVHLNKFF